MEEISISRIVDVILLNMKKIIIVFVLGLIVAIGLLLYSLIFIEKEYKATATVIIPNSGKIDEYSEIIKKDSFLRSISEEFGVGIEELKEKIIVDLKDKKIFSINISYTGNDAQNVYNVTSKIASEFISTMNDMYKFSSVNISDEPTIPENYYNFSIKKIISNCIKIIFLPIIIYLIILLSIEFFSNKVKTEEFIEKYLKLKMLSTISLIDTNKDSKYYKLQNDNVANRLISNLKRNKDNKLTIMFTNASEVKSNFIEILKSISNTKQKVLLLNFDKSVKIPNIENIIVKENISDIDNEYDILILNTALIDGISVDEKLFKYIDNFVVFSKHGATKIENLELASKILDEYNKIDDSYCIMIGEEYLKEKEKYNKYKNRLKREVS